MKFIGFAALFALVGAAASCGAAYWAATQWTSFSNHWLYAAGFVPCLGAILGGFIGSEKGAWPPAMPKKLALCAVSSVCAGIGSYVAFAAVSSRWNNVAQDAGDFVSVLMTPSRIPDIFTTTSTGSTGSGMGPLAQLAIGMAVGAIVPLLWLRKTAEKK